MGNGSNLSAFNANQAEQIENYVRNNSKIDGVDLGEMYGMIKDTQEEVKSLKDDIDKLERKFESRFDRLEEMIRSKN